MITSTFRKIWNHTPLEFPEFTGTRIMMMPVRLGYGYGVPTPYSIILYHLYSVMERRFFNEIGYLTIDEQDLDVGKTLRRPGWHVDGYYHGNCGAWGGGGGNGGSWGSVGNGMLLVSNTSHCEAVLGMAEGEPGPEGECEHRQIRGLGHTLFEPGEVYWLDGGCIHRSLEVTEPTRRQLVRLSMPSSGPWFEGYTENPEGILPSNEILPARTEFMG